MSMYEPHFPPDETDEWLPLCTQARVVWLHAVRMFHCDAIQNIPIVDKPGTIEIDGKKINDRPSIFLTLGEAVNGPGGYFGNCLDSLADCFCGGFGVAHPTTVIWRHSATSRRQLDRFAPPNYFNDAVETLRLRASDLSLE